MILWDDFVKVTRKKTGRLGRIPLYNEQRFSNNEHQKCRYFFPHFLFLRVTFLFFILQPVQQDSIK